MDQFYYEYGYIDEKYFVYIAEAEVVMGPYIDEGYIEYNYYEDYSALSSLTCDFDVVTGVTVEASGSWSSEFAVTALVGNIKQVASAQSSEFAQTTAAGRIVEANAAFTDAFTPTLIADAFKNHTAALETQATMTVTAVVDRSANVLLEHIAALNLMADRFAGASASQTATTTAVTDASGVFVAASDISVISSIDPDVFRVEFFPATAISAASNIFASRYLGEGRPRNLTAVTGPVYTTTSKFGSHALTSSSTVRYDNIQGAIPEPNQTWAMQFWLAAGDTSSPDVTFISFSRILGGNRFIQISNTDNSRFITVSVQKKNLTPSPSYTTSNQLTRSSTVYNHVAIVYESGYLAVWINGTRGIYADLTANINDDWTGRLNEDDPTRLQISLTNSRSLDDFVFVHDSNLGFSPSSTTITVPTTRSENDLDKTQFLYHFDNDLSDDISLTQTAASNLSMAVALSAQANPNTKQIAADISSTLSLTAQAGLILDYAADISSESTSAATVQATKRAVSAVSAESAQTTTVNPLRDFEIAAGALFAPQITVQAQLAGVALLETQSQSSVQAVKTARVESSIIALASITTTTTRTAGAAATATVIADISADTIRQRSAASTASMESTLVADSDKILGLAINAVATASVTVAVVKLKIAFADAASSAATTVAAVKTTDISSDFAVSTAINTLNVRVRFSDSAQTSAFTQNTLAVKTTDIASTQNSQFTDTTQAVKTADAVIAALTLFSPTVDADFTVRPQVFLESQATLSLTATRIFDIDIKQTISGVNFANDSLIKIRNTQPINPPFTQSAPFLVSFWAYEPNGTLLDWFPFDVNGDIGRLQIQSGTVTWENLVDSGNDRRRVQWTVDTGLWHHYLIYAASNSTARLYLDGEEVTGTVTTIDDGNQPPLPPSSDQIATDNTWILGANTSNWRNSINEVTDGAHSINSMQGAVTQFVAYWINTPDATDSAVRQRFYDNGYVDLGTDGTLSGSDQPTVYLRLTDTDDLTQRGTVTDQLVEWRQVTVTDYDPSWDNVDWSLTSAYTPTVDNLTVQGLQSRFAVAVRFIGVFLYQVNINAVTAQITLASRTRASAVAMSTSLSLTVVAGGGVFGGTAQVLAQTTLSSTVTNIRSSAVTMEATASMVPAVGFIKLFEIAVLAETTVVAAVDVKPPIRIEADLVSATTVVCDASSFTDAIALFASSGQLIADVTLIPPIRIEADLQAEFTVSAIVGSIEQFAVLTVSSGTMQISAVKTTDIVQDLTADSQAALEAKKFTGIIGAFTALYAQVTVIDIINIDPYLTLVVKPETRAVIILPENRIITIDSETRVNII